MFWATTFRAADQNILFGTRVLGFCYWCGVEANASRDMMDFWQACRLICRHLHASARMYKIRFTCQIDCLSV